MTRYSAAISQTAAKFSGISRFFHLSSCPVYNEPHQLCDYGQRQTMNHVVDILPLTKFEGGLNLLHEADDDTVIWLESTVTAALTHTHTRLTALSGTTQASRYQKGETNVDFTEAVSGSSISWAMCKSTLRSRQLAMPAPHHSVFYRPDALPAAQPTVSKH